MSVRRSPAGTWDHGAQFFTTRDATFTSWVQHWRKRGVVTEWNTGFATSDDGRVERGRRYFRGRDGMNAPAKYLAKDLTVRLDERVEMISVKDGQWFIQTGARTEIKAEGLIMTPPVPQTLTLLRRSGVTLPESERETLEAIRYDPCIALLLALDGETAVPDPGGLFCDGEPIAWLADNRKKGISSNPTITVHAGPKFSRDSWDADDEQIKNRLLEGADAWIGSRVVEYQVHRWRYSKPVETHPQRTARLSTPLPLFLAGDAFGGPRVEGAAVSGIAAAEAVLKIRNEM